MKHFQSLFQAPTVDMSGFQIEPMVGTRIDATQAFFLEREFSDIEIKEVVFSINPGKAPGPDGFNGFFFQRMWYLIGEEVTQAIKSFFQHGQLLKEVNHTYLALIPKKPNATRLTDFRPIPCCNFCISALVS